MMSLSAKLLRARRVLIEEGPAELVRKAGRFTLRTGQRWTSRLGSGHECPVCGFTGRSFLAAGTPKRPGVFCPDCMAAERHRLLWYYLVNELEVPGPKQRLLYLSPHDSSPLDAPRGSRPLETQLRKRTNVVTADITMKDVDIHGDITKLPFQESSFEMVICLHILEHIPDDRTAIAEMARVLRPGGVALIMIPKHKDREITEDNVPDVNKKELGEGLDHVHEYGRDVTDRLKGAGFEVSVEAYGEELPSEVVQRHGLRLVDFYDGKKYEDIHVCRVAL